MATAGLDLGNLLVHLRADATQFNRVIKGVTNTVKNVAKSVTTFATTVVTKTVGMVVKTVKYTLGMLRKYSKWALAALVAQLTVATYAFMQFEERMANVSTMLDDQTMKYMPRYAKAIGRLAVEFGEGTQTLSKGLYDILSASIPASKAMMVLRASVIAAKAGMTDTGTAADAITTILNAYDLSAEKAGYVSDILFGIVKKGKTTFGELAPNIGKVAGMASVAGLSLEQLGAALATMTRVLPTPIATTAARSIVMGFMKPMGNAKLAAKKFNLELNTTTLRTIGLTGVLKKLKNATAEEVAAILPNIRGLAGFAVALKQIGKNAEDLDLMMKSSGLTLKAYDKMTNTLRHSWNRAKQVFILASVTIGRMLAPAMKVLADSTIDAVMRLIEFMERPSIILAVTKWSLTIAAYINFVRKVMKDFLVGLVANWPSTWKYMKDIALAYTKIIWKSFQQTGTSALSILTETFKAFGKNMVLVFEKIWADIEGIWGKKRFYHAVLEGRFRALTGLSQAQTGEWPANPITMSYLKGKYPREYAEAREWAEEKTAKRKEMGGFSSIGWGDVGKEMIDNLATAMTYAKSEGAKIAKEIEKIQAEELAGITRPEWLEGLIDKRLVELKKREKEIADLIKKMRAEGAFEPDADGDGPGRKRESVSPPGGEVVKAAKPKSLQFTAFKEAWKRFGESAQPDDTIQKAQLAHLANIDENVERGTSEGGMTE